MTARATVALNSGHGAFLPRDPLVGVPDETVAAWVEAGLAAYDPEPVEPAAEPDLEDLKRPALVALAEGLDLDTSGTRAVLIARIRDAQGEPGDPEPDADAEPDPEAAADAESPGLTADA